MKKLLGAVLAISFRILSKLRICLNHALSCIQAVTLTRLPMSWPNMLGGVQIRISGEESHSQWLLI